MTRAEPAVILTALPGGILIRIIAGDDLMLQSRINRLVKRMPGDKIEFMGYIWPTELIQPGYDFNKLEYPTLMQCLEHIIGVDLSLYYDGPPKREVNDFVLWGHISHITGRAAMSSCHMTGQADPVGGYTRKDREQEFLEFNGLVFQIYDDILMDIYTGALTDKKYNTVKRSEFIEWSRLYLNPDPPKQKETPGLKWTGITATFLNETEILFQFSGDSIEKNYRQLGFADGRNGRPRKSWNCFLRASGHNGQVLYLMSDRTAVEKEVEFIRKKLRKLFPGVDGDPIPHKSGCYNFEIHLKNTFAEK